MRLGRVIRAWRIHAEKNLRDTAKEIGISTSTLSRVEKGEAMDGDSLVMILVWLTGKVKQS